jgi:hypothetical protein
MKHGKLTLVPSHCETAGWLWLNVAVYLWSRQGRWGLLRSNRSSFLANQSMARIERIDLLMAVPGATLNPL